MLCDPLFYHAFRTIVI